MQREGREVIFVSLKRAVAAEGERLKSGELTFMVDGERQAHRVNLDDGEAVLNKAHLFACSRESMLSAEWVGDQPKRRCYIEFPLGKLASMPRVKHVIEAKLV